MNTETSVEAANFERQTKFSRARVGRTHSEGAALLCCEGGCSELKAGR